MARNRKSLAWVTSKVEFDAHETKLRTSSEPAGWDEDQVGEEFLRIQRAMERFRDRSWPESMVMRRELEQAMDAWFRFAELWFG